MATDMIYNRDVEGLLHEGLYFIWTDSEHAENKVS